MVVARVGVSGALFVGVPGSLLPEEDQGYNFLVMLLPPAASLDRTKQVVSTVAENVQKNPAVKDIVAFAGFDILSSAQKTSAGVAFVCLKDWPERTDPAMDARKTAPAFGALNGKFRDGFVIGFNPPPIQGISTTGGFEFYLQDRTGGTLDGLAQAANKVVAAAAQRP